MDILSLVISSFSTYRTHFFISMYGKIPLCVRHLDLVSIWNIDCLKEEWRLKRPIERVAHSSKSSHKINQTCVSKVRLSVKPFECCDLHIAITLQLFQVASGCEVMNFSQIPYATASIS